MRFALMIPAIAALSACGGEREPAEAERPGAAGEVLGGEISDDMLPLDTVQSTSPVDPRAGATGTDADGDADEDSATAPADPEPGALPTPEIRGGPGQRQSTDIPPAQEPTPE